MAETHNPLQRFAAIPRKEKEPRTTPTDDRQANYTDTLYFWGDEAACRGRSSDMFPSSHKDISYVSLARKICATCPVKEDCLDYALTFPPTDMNGVWAGLTPRQLAAEQQRRGIRPEDLKPTIAEMWSHFDHLSKKAQRPFSESEALDGE